MCSCGITEPCNGCTCGCNHKATTPNIQQLALAKVDERITELENGINLVESKGFLGTKRLFVQESKMELSFLRALRSVIVATATNGYTTWDKSMVPMVDGEYDIEATKKWELHHGHDIRLKCYTEFGCQLLIDPEDLMLDIAKELEIK